MGTLEEERERHDGETSRKKCAEDFTKARQAGNFRKMNDAYEKLWELPPTEETGTRARMNKELMKMCRLPGLYYPAPGIEERIAGHDPADPLPDGLFGVLPHAPEPGDDRWPFAGRDMLPSGCAFRDETDEIRYYYPAADEDGRPCRIAVCVWDKKAKKSREWVICPDLHGRYVSRVAAVSSGGHFLLAELRPYPKENAVPEDEFTIACITRNGRRTAELFRGTGKASFEGFFLEDGQQGPDRGLLWIPGSRRLIYFEREGDSFYTEEDPRRFRHLPYAFPVPDEVFPEESFGKPARESGGVIEYAAVSPDGENLAMVILGGAAAKEPQRTLYIWRKADNTREYIRFGSVSSILLARDFRFILAGRPADTGTSCRLWQFFPGVMEHKQKPLWEFRESSSGSRIASVSYDLCSLLDDRGLPVYDIFWRYREGENIF